MAKPLTTSKLIDSVKQRAMLPTNSKTFSDDDLVGILNEEMDTGIVPEVLKQHEEYYTVSEDQPFVEGQTRYRIPYRAIGNKLRDVAYIDTNGNFYELSRISLEELSDYQNDNNFSLEEVFYVEHNEIVFPRKEKSGGTLRMYFHLRPNSLVLEGQVSVITAINRVSGIITVSSLPTSFNSAPVMDFVASKSPNRIEGYDIQPISVNTENKEVEFNVGDIPEYLSIGDFICLAQESPVPQIPVEMHTMLAQKAAIFCLEALNDTEGLSNAQRKMERMERDIDTIINNRVEGAPKKIVNRRGTVRDSAYKSSFKRRF